MTIITQAILEQGRSSNGAFSRKQIKCFNVGKHVQKGLVGRDVPDDKIEKFISLKNKHIKKVVSKEQKVFKFIPQYPEIKQLITKDIIEQGKSRNGGWNLKQLQLFGFDNFRKNWQKMVIGQEWPREIITQFIKLKNAHLK